MSSSALLAFDLAIRPDEPSQLNFIAEIPSILSSFPREWHSAHFLPFLANWLLPNNNSLVLALLSSLPLLIETTSLDAATPLFEIIFGPDDRSRTQSLVSIILKFTTDQTAPACLTRLSQSPWDSVRAAVPRIISILKSDEEKHLIFSLLLVPGAPFKVRYSIAQSVPDLSDALAHTVVTALLTDPNGRIRGLLPAVTASRSFFLESVVPVLSSDHDWAVRASLASSLVNVADALAGVEVGATLLNDAVWRVKLCALRSLTGIIRKLDPVIELSNVDRLRELISETRNKYEIPTLKKALIDLFIVLYTRKPIESDQEFVTALITQEDQSVQLHFLTQAVVLQCANIILFIENQLLDIILELSRSEQWRDRVGTVELLTDLITLIGGDQLKESFAKICLALVKDEASLVRMAAVKQLANLSDTAIVKGQLPSSITTLAGSTTFRDRQAAILLIQAVYRNLQSDDEKELLRNELKKFEADGECPNVVSLAKSVISELTQ